MFAGLWTKPKRGRRADIFIRAHGTGGFSGVATKRRIPQIIIDLDYGQDPDDLLDLAMLHCCETAGQCNILATTYCHTDTWGAMALDAVNHFYGRYPRVARAKISASANLGDVYGTYTASNFPHPSLSSDALCPDATTAMREQLDGADDKSVTLIFTGSLRNLYNLYASTATDPGSSFDGPTLIAQKVYEIVIAAGEFPDSSTMVGPPAKVEYNIAASGNHTTAANVLNLLPSSVRVVASGYSLGASVYTGSMINQVFGVSDLVRSVANYAVGGSWTYRSAWAQVAIIYAIFGTSYRGQTLFTLTGGDGRIKVNQSADQYFTFAGGAPAGANKFVTDGSTQHFYLGLAPQASRDDVACIANGFMACVPGTIPAPIAPAVELWRKRVIVNGGSATDSEIGLLDQFVANACAAGYWPKIGMLWIPAGSNLSAACVLLKCPGAATGICTQSGFSAGHYDRIGGLDNTATGGNGAGYLDTLIPAGVAANGINMTNADAHLMVWSGTDVVGNSTFDIGTDTGGIQTELSVAYSSVFTGVYFDSHTIASARVNTGSAITRLGFVMGSRLANSGAGATALYQGLSSAFSTLATGTVGGAGGASTGVSIKIFGVATAGAKAPRKLHAASAGLGMTAVQAALFYSDLRNLLLALGKSPTIL